jgi:RNA polymerase sigma-70 factor (ECF subfamily)
MPRGEDESGLIRAAQQGKTGAFHNLVRRYDGDILRLALRITGCPDQARAIYQEAFLRIYHGLSDFPADCAFSTWVYRIVTEICLERLRDSQRVARPTETGEIESALDRLTPRERLVLELTHNQKMKLDTVGEVLQTSEEAARKALFRATHKLTSGAER